jgi:hypothetical protein
MSKRKSVIRLMAIGALACIGAVGPSATAAFAGAVHADPSTLGPIDIGPSPVGVPANCPFPNGDSSFAFTSGHAVLYGTSNKNGDWGGGTAEGPGVFMENGTPLYQGHLSYWTGGGNNIQGQNQGSFTLDFNGTGLSDPSQNVSIHLNAGSATPAHGTIPTSNRVNVNITCA